MLGFVFGRTIGFGLRAGGFSCTPILGATMGLKVLMVSLEELVLRRIWGSELLNTTLCRGLSDSVELAGVGVFFICSKVSNTTSGACLAELCRSSSRSSFSAVFIVSSMSWVRAQERAACHSCATECQRSKGREKEIHSSIHQSSSNSYDSAKINFHQIYLKEVTVWQLWVDITNI